MHTFYILFLPRSLCKHQRRLSWRLLWSLLGRFLWKNQSCFQWNLLKWFLWRLLWRLLLCPEHWFCKISVKHYLKTLQVVSLISFSRPPVPRMTLFFECRIPAWLVFPKWFKTCWSTKKNDNQEGDMLRKEIILYQTNFAENAGETRKNCLSNCISDNHPGMCFGETGTGNIRGIDIRGKVAQHPQDPRHFLKDPLRST